jgi:hypothetical protein
MRMFPRYLLIACLFAPACAHAATYYVTVAGLGGEPDYEQRFTAEAKDLDKLFKDTGPDAVVYTLTGADATRAKLLDTLSTIAAKASPDDTFIITLIGHGSFDGTEYKFNLVGPDITATALAAACDHIHAQRQLVVNTTSASGGSLAELLKPGRAIIVATKNGTEKNATVFARYWVEALQDPSADLDKSDSINAMEAFEFADRKTTDFYATQKRLATEHAEFEDTGKGAPVRAVSADEGQTMRGITVLRIGASQKAANDPARHTLLEKKEALEQKIDALKYQKAAMEADDYKKQLTAVLLELAELEQELEK